MKNPGGCLKVGLGLLLVVFCVVISGCESEHASRRGSGYVGQDASVLVDHYGQPDQVLKDGSGGRILYYGPIPIDDGMVDDRRSGPHRMPAGGKAFRINSNGTVYSDGF